MRPFYLLALCLLAISLVNCSAEHAQQALDSQLEKALTSGAITAEHLAFVNSVLVDEDGGREHAGLVLEWGLQNNVLFSQLVAGFGTEQIELLADVAIATDRSFLLIERLIEYETRSGPLLTRLRQLEDRDLRERVPRHRLLMDSALRGIAQIVGRNGDRTWDGAAILVLESDCELAFLGAGHTMKRSKHAQETTGETSTFEIRFDDQVFSPRVIITPDSVIEPENDWALTTVAKRKCGQQYQQWLPEFFPFDGSRGSALEVDFYCQHRRPRDPGSALYSEPCRLHATDAGVLDLYADKTPGLIGVHSCISASGSSGCPMFHESQQQLQLLGVQIERDKITRAGIVRLISGELRQALNQLAEDFAAQSGY